MNFKSRPVFRADTGCRGYHRRDPRFLPSRAIIYGLRLPVVPVYRLRALSSISAGGARFARHSLNRPGTGSARLAVIAASLSAVRLYALRIERTAKPLAARVAATCLLCNRTFAAED